MPWRPPYEDVNATFAPTYNVDDDAVLLSNLLEQLTLADLVEMLGAEGTVPPAQIQMPAVQSTLADVARALVRGA